MHAYSYNVKIYRTKQNFSGHVLWSCGFRKVWYEVVFEHLDYEYVETRLRTAFIQLSEKSTRKGYQMSYGESSN